MLDADRAIGLRVLVLNEPNAPSLKTLPLVDLDEGRVGARRRDAACPER
jgi:hypothetical protein